MPDMESFSTLLTCIPFPQLVQGEAEIFGTELALGEQLSLRGQKLAVGMSFISTTHQWRLLKVVAVLVDHPSLKLPGSLHALDSGGRIQVQVFTWNGCTIELAAEGALVDDIVDSV